MRGTRTSISRVAVIILICVAGCAAAGVYSGAAGTAGDLDGDGDVDFDDFRIMASNWLAGK